MSRVPPLLADACRVPWATRSGTALDRPVSAARRRREARAVMAVRLWSDLTTGELSGRDMRRTIAVLPVAAVEQHGPHLPLSTDCDIAEGYLARVRALARAEHDADLDVLLLPVQSVGKSDEHDAFPGTLSLDIGTALAAWTGIGAAVHRAGCRKLVIVTSHGGNSALIDLVAGELRGRLGMVAVTTAWARFGYPDGPVPGGGNRPRDPRRRRRDRADAGPAAGSRADRPDRGFPRRGPWRWSAPSPICAPAARPPSPGRPATCTPRARSATRASARPKPAARRSIMAPRAFLALLRDVDAFALDGSGRA